MHKVIINAQLISPTAIVRRRQDDVMRCLDYIPAATLRGAIAQRIIDVHGSESVEFKSLFLSQLRWPNLYPALPGQLSNPLPKSARSCKYHPGFVSQSSNGEPNHGMHCSLIDYVTELDDPASDMLLTHCPECNADLKSQSGYYCDQRLLKLEKMIQHHVGIDSYTKAARKSILYGIEALQPSSEIALTGAIRLTAEQRSMLEDLIGSDDIVLMGRSRSRGYGEVEISLTETNPDHNDQSNSDSILEDLTHFDAAFKAELARRALGVQSGTYFTVHARSGLILLDKCLRATAELPDLGFDYQVISSHFSSACVQGWSRIHGLPKQQDQAIEAGAVWLMHSPLEALELAPKLCALEIAGIGERRDEGFGEINFCQNFCINSLTGIDGPSLKSSVAVDCN